MHVRKAEARDRAGAVDLAIRFMTSTAFSIAASPRVSRLERLFDLALPGGGIFVAVEGDVVVGVIVLVALEHPYSGERYADELVWYVAPEHRTGTAGPRLLKAALEWARQQGLSLARMVAPAGAQGRAVQRYLERLGFTPLETAYVRRF